MTIPTKLNSAPTTMIVKPALNTRVSTKACPPTPSNPFSWGSHLLPLSMRKPDRIGAIVLAFTLFVAYWGWAALLYFQGVVSLPLGGLGTEGLLLVLVDVVIVILYPIRQRRRASKVQIRASKK